MLRILAVSLLLLCYVAVKAQEICNNGIDDDGDGFTDLLDTDCTPAIYPLLKNPSFEKVNQCPGFYSQLQYAQHWLQPGPGNVGSTDLYHTCGGCSYKFVGISGNMPKPLPDGVGFAGVVDAKEWASSGIWKEYIGACPDKELEKDSQYVLNFYLGFISPYTSGSESFAPFSPVSFSLFGHSNCGAIPYATPGNNTYRNCPVSANPQWVELARVSISGTGGDWVKARVEFTAPKNIGSVVLGPSCEASPFGANNLAGYYGIDQVLLYKKDVYDLPVITRAGDICADTLLLKASTNLPVPAGSWQWYRDDIALPGETAANLRLTRWQYGIGTYKVRLLVNNKTLLSPETIVSIDDTEFFMPDSISFCAGQGREFDPLIEKEEASCSLAYLWSDGLTSAGRYFSAGGRYWFETNKNGCRRRDTITVIERVAPRVDLGRDTTLCRNESLVLSAGNPGADFLWQNNSTAPNFLVTKPGSYAVKVSAFGCTTADTIAVKYETNPTLFFASDTILCKDEQKRLAPQVYGNNFLWNTGSTSPEITVTQPGTYLLEVKNFCGSIKDSITIKRMNCEFWLPSAFTPNNDNLNDHFGLAVSGFVKKYNCRIYNRWGQLVFASTNPLKHWDGNVKGKPAVQEVYAWVIEYTAWTGISEVKKGTVTLLR